VENPQRPNRQRHNLQRPNFVVVVTDDQGPWAMPHRMPELQMPHLHQLLTESLEFEQAYCASPVCSPSRASMLTGRTPSAHGVHDWLVGGRHPQAHPDHHLDGQPTTPEVLAEAGYQCALSGKWHVGDSRLPAPGFEYWYAHRFGSGPYVDAPIWRDGRAATEPRYLTRAITEQAIDFLHHRDPDRPFLLLVHYTAPHAPWVDGNHPDDLTSRYEGCRFESVPWDADPHPWMTPREQEYLATRQHPIEHLTGYCASLSGVDEGLGQLRGALDEQGVADSTILVYLSDNGFSWGHHGIWGKGNGTWPVNFWHQSVSVPLLVHVPGGPRGTTDRLVSTRALHGTLCELAGVEIPDDRWGPRDSFADSLVPGRSGESESGSGADVVVVTSEYGQGRMITDGRYVLVLRPQGPDEFYDRGDDPDEQHNRIDDPSLAEVRDRLSARLEAWFDRYSRADQTGWDKPVTGLGQIHPPSRGVAPERSYVQFDDPPYDR